jgi:hypothetical protein
MTASCQSRQSGITLIELLIAVTLVSLLITGMLFAIRVGLVSMDRTNARLMSNRRVTSVERILRRQIADAIPVGAPCGSPTGQKFSFFAGDQRSLHIVSSYSLQEASRGYPRILEYLVIPGQNGEGVRLIVNERFYPGAMGAGSLCGGMVPDAGNGSPGPQFAPIQVGPLSFVLADKLAYCRFVYRETLPPPEMEKWWPSWGRPLLPSAVRIEMAPLRFDPASLPLLSVTIPIHVNRDPLVKYGD